MVRSGTLEERPRFYIFTLKPTKCASRVSARACPTAGACASCVNVMCADVHSICQHSCVVRSDVRCLMLAHPLTDRGVRKSASTVKR